MQNLVVEFPCSIPASLCKFEGCFGTVGLKVLFGRTHQRVTGYFSSPDGMNLDTLVLAVEKFKHVVFSRTNVNPLDRSMLVKRVEFFKDYPNLRMSGISCITIESLYGNLEKIYQKKHRVRSEIRVHNTSLASVYMLLKGGVAVHDLEQTLRLLIKELETLIRCIKYQKQGVQKVYTAFLDFLRRVDRQSAVEDGSKINRGGCAATGSVVPSNQLDTMLRCTRKGVDAPSKIASLHALNVRGNGGIQTESRSLGLQEVQTADGEAAGELVMSQRKPPLQGLSVLRNSLTIGDVFFVRYHDAVLFKDVLNSDDLEPVVRETVGWLSCENAEYIRLVWERYADPGISDESRLRTTGLAIRRTDVIEIRRLSSP